ncbi:MAG: hypothetical protein R2794_00275 [Chitinophagales bacterium]
MGLDGLELLMRIESYFQIEISDSEAAEIFTVSDLIHCIKGKIQPGKSDHCLGQELFYRIRQYFIQEKGFLKEQLTPQTKLFEILGNDRTHTWKSLAEYIGMRLPKLNYLDTHPEAPEQIAVFGVRMWSRKKPLTEGVVSDLVYWIMALQYKELFKPGLHFMDKDLEAITIGIIHDTLGVPVDEIDPAKSIVRDLGIE